MNTDSLMFTFVVIPLFAPWCWDDPVSIALSRLAHRTVFVLAEMRHFHWIFRKRKECRKRERTEQYYVIICWRTEFCCQQEGTKTFLSYLLWNFFWCTTAFPFRKLSFISVIETMFYADSLLTGAHAEHKHTDTLNNK